MSIFVSTLTGLQRDPNKPYGFASFLSDLFEYKQRCGRIEFLSLFFTTIIACSLVIGLVLFSGFIISVIFENRALNVFGFILSAAVSIFFTIRILFLIVRRLHDLNLSGYYLILLILFNILSVAGYGLLGIIFDLLLVILPGSSGENNYGPQPEAPNKIDIALAILCIPFYILSLKDIL